MTEDWAQQRQQREAARRAAVMALPTVQARHHAQLVPPQQGDVRVSASVGPSGEVVALWSAGKDLAALTSTTTQPGWATFPDPQAPRPAAARVTVHAPDMAIAARIPSLPLAHPSVQPLPDGQVLVVGARCRWRPDGPDRNAIVYDSTGTVLTEQTLGDGIEHVQTTRGGEIWVGYFDEGVYGNYGWGDEDSEPPVGACGLIRYSAAFTQEWRYPSHVDNTWGAISDCYALNVADDTAWTCYYTDFPIVRIHNDTMTGWHNDIPGAKALVVGGFRIALYGGYGPDHDKLVVGILSGDRLHVTGEYRLVQPDGRPVPPTAHVVGRGPDLHLVVDDNWWRLDLDDIPAEPPR
ncbi:hypothetical protein [Amycolatopsis aidingensis]|uniref:hypothetical protein n=1 Tax=Amycolatopsis aidingensis TaxID=2842453 RepID=UPI001C0D242B|nr:hypothetical protein [Amycolatopsis aidingensis]